MSLHRGAVIALLLCSASAWAEKYVYDAQGRVTEVTYDDGSKTVYSYDAAGNMVRQVDTAIPGIVDPPPPPPPPPPPSCGCDAAPFAGLLAALLWAVRRRARASPRPR